MTDFELKCRCGHVHVRLFGSPITVPDCYCDDCQSAADHFEALPNAPKVMNSEKGTCLALFRNDKYEVLRGADKLEPVKTKKGSITNRNLATCCNSLLFASFDRGPHWVSVYRQHIQNASLNSDYAIQTKFAPTDIHPTQGQNVAKAYPPMMIAKLMLARLKMKIGF